MKVAVAGMGLIGGSIYKAAVQAGYEVLAIHHDDAIGEIDADFVFVAMPPKATESWIINNAKLFRPDTIVMDVCGVKREITKVLSDLTEKSWYFIPAHPMAGRENSGFENSLANLFVGASMIFTPSSRLPKEVLEKAKKLCCDLGFAKVVVTDAETHDEMIAFTSQLCHVIASAYSSDDKTGEKSIGFSAGSYADMTRIATMDEKVWASLFLSNADKLSQTLGAFIDRISQYKDAIDRQDKARLESLIIKGAELKRRENALLGKGV